MTQTASSCLRSCLMVAEDESPGRETIERDREMNIQEGGRGKSSPSKGPGDAALPRHARGGGAGKDEEPSLDSEG